MKVNERTQPRIGKGIDVPLPQPRPQIEEQQPAEPGSWTPQGPNGAKQPAGQPPSFQPVDSESAAAAMLDSVKQLAPMGISGVDPTQLLEGVKDGKATLSIPLQPGKYKVQGHGFEVKPGTVARVQVEVKDGRIVPAVDQHGRPTGRGTKIEIDPPVDLPLWATGKGAYVKDQGGAQAAFKADIGGFFDKTIAEFKSTKLSDVVRGLSAQNGDSAGAGGLPKGLMRPEQVRFEAQVSMKDNVVSAGAAKVDLAPGSNLKISGTGRNAVLDGQVNIDGARLEQAGTSVKLGPGAMHLHAEYAAAPDGRMQLQTRITDVNARIENLSLEHARKPGDTDPDRLELGNATIKNGSFTLDATLKSQPGSAIPSLETSTVRLNGEAEGSLMGAKLTLKDAQDDAELKVGPGRFKGALDVKPEGTRVDGEIKGTTLDVRDLQTKNANAKLGVHHGHFEGDVKLSSDPAAGNFDLNVAASKVDVRIDGYRGSSDKTTVDFKRIDVTGAGNININSKTGTTVEGDMHVRGEVNELGVTGKVDVAQGSTVDGRATRFHAGGSEGFSLKADAVVDANVKSFDVATTGVSVKGQARMRGDAQLDIRGGEVNLVFKNATAQVDVDDAKVGTAGGAIALDVAKGSKATLNIAEARFGEVESVKLGPGSVLDATLDEGHITAGGRRVDLEPGAKARFEMSALDAKPGESPSVRGSLSLDTKLRTSDLSGLELGGVKVKQAGPTAGHVKLEVPDVSLTPDGKVTYNDAHVSLDARIGDVKPGTKPVPQLPAHPKGVLSEEAVQKTTAADIAGAQMAGRPENYQPFDAIRRVRNGTVELEIPVDGRYGDHWYDSADFAKGTTLRVQLKVKDGKVVPSESKAQFSKPGDGPGWVTAKGVYFDAENSLKVELSGWKDRTVDKMDKLPLDMDQLVDRLKKNAESSALDPTKFSAFQFNDARIDVKDATFAPGKLAVPGGWIDVGANTKLSVKGTMKSAELSGKVDLNGVDITQSGVVALKGNKGTADLNIKWNDGVATTTLNHLNVDTEYAVQKRENGDYIKLAKGRVTDGRLQMVVPVNTAALTAGFPTQATLHVPVFSGTIEGARLTAVDDQGKRSQLEIGKAQVDGEVHIDPKNIEVKGKIRDADLAATGLAASTASGGAEIEYARLAGSGTLDFSSKRGLKVDAEVTAVDIRAKQVQADRDAAKTAAQRTRITGAGHVAWSTEQGLSIEGQLHVEADVSGEIATKAGALPKRTPVGRTPVERTPVPVKRITIERGTMQATRSPASAGQKNYSVVANDTLSRLALEAYGDANKWTLIRDANPGQVEMRGGTPIIRIGAKLEIPATQARQ